MKANKATSENVFDYFFDVGARNSYQKRKRISP